MWNEDYERVEQALHYLEQHYQEQPSLEEIAGSVRLSKYHFQRLFSRWAGISPKRFLQYLTAGHATRLLRASHTNLEAAYDAGLSGGGRLHDLLAKGVDRRRAERAIAEVLEVEGLGAPGRARQLAEKRAAQLGGVPPRQKRRRLLAYLARRGFRGREVQDMVMEILRGASQPE